MTSAGQTNTINKQPKGTQMGLIRKEVIDLMTKEIQDMNKLEMEKYNMPYEQQKLYLEQSLPELDRVNGMLYDMLVKNGVIR
jgi:hypothetical protein